MLFHRFLDMDIVCFFTYCFNSETGRQRERRLGRSPQLGAGAVVGAPAPVRHARTCPTAQASPYRVLPSFSGFYRIILVLTDIYWVLLGFNGF